MPSGVFSVLPENFFSPLAGIDKQYYAALFEYAVEEHDGLNSVSVSGFTVPDIRLRRKVTT
jgi:hypothetical protein